MFEQRLSRYFNVLTGVTTATLVTKRDGSVISLAKTIEELGQLARKVHASGNKLMFIGNGGSAGIASHMAIDYSKNGGIRSTAFNDGAALTCLGNDLGYEQVFAKQIDLHAREGDMLIAISSSGNSKNIINAVNVAIDRGCIVVTLSGFKPDNALRSAGDYNLYIPSKEYGFVEIGHLSLIHSILDLEMGWGKEATSEEESFLKSLDFEAA